MSVTPEDVFKTEGVEPSHVVDILSLMGDSVDNIPGVPGIGPKTAAKLVLEFGSIDGIYEHIDEIKGKRHENLVASKDAMPLNRSRTPARRRRDRLPISTGVRSRRRRCPDPVAVPRTRVRSTSVANSNGSSAADESRPGAMRAVDRALRGGARCGAGSR